MCPRGGEANFLVFVRGSQDGFPNPKLRTQLAPPGVMGGEGFKFDGRQSQPFANGCEQWLRLGTIELILPKKTQLGTSFVFLFKPHQFLFLQHMGKC